MVCSGASGCKGSVSGHEEDAFASPLPLSSWMDLSVSTSDYPHHSACIHRDKVLPVGPRHLPRFWGPKPKATTEVTLYEQPTRLFINLFIFT